MKETFTASKVVNDIIAFDKEHKLIRFLINEDQPIIHYEDIEKCELTNEYFEKPALSMVSNMFTMSGVLASETSPCVSVSK